MRQENFTLIKLISGLFLSSQREGSRRVSISRAGVSRLQHVAKPGQGVENDFHG